MHEDVTRQLAECVVNTEYKSLSADDIANTKLMVLDSIGCALGGYITDRAGIVLELVEEFGGNHEATVIGSRKTSCPLAAFANSELLNALDYDYLGPVASHVAPYTASPCFAVAEREHASGKDLIVSYALAHEVGGRAINSVAQHKVLKDEPPYYETHPRFTFATSIFGGVAGAGKLLGLDVAHLLHAFGIAGASTPVPASMKWEEMSGPAIMAKYNAWSGWTSQLATVSVLAAERGFTGDTSILDGEWGYWQIVGSPFFKVDSLLKDLGKVWHVSDEVRFKLYPTCYIYHAAIEGISTLMKENGIKPDDVDEIVVKGDPLMQTPNRMGLEVNTFADAQFFIKFNMALAVYHGDQPSPSWQIPSTYNDPRIGRLVDQVKLEVHPDVDEFAKSMIKEGKTPVMLGAIVELAAKGKRFSIEMKVPKGSKGNPATEQELIEKFNTNASYSMIKTGKIEQVIEMTMHLEDIDDVTKLFALLAL